jgi:hypothetical protein
MPLLLPSGCSSGVDMVQAQESKTGMKTHQTIGIANGSGKRSDNCLRIDLQPSQIKIL